MLIEQAIDQYLFFLRSKERSKSTLINYRHYLNRFLSFCHRHSPPLSTIADLNESHLKDYENFLSKFSADDGLPLQRKTKAYHLIALRGLVDFLNKKGSISLSADIISLPKIVKQLPPAVDQLTVQKILAQPAWTTKQGLRDRIILELLANLGLLVSEIVNLNRDDVNLVNETLVVGRTTDRERVCYLPKNISLLLARYLVRRSDSFPPLFIRYRGKKINPQHIAREIRLSSRSIQRLVKKYAKKAGIKQQITPQILRHSLAVRLLKEGTSKSQVRKLLGLKTDQAIEGYIIRAEG